MPKRIQMGLLLTVAAVAAACSSSTDTGTGGTGGTDTNRTTLHQVQATTNLAFTPSSVSIQPGDSVLWVFASVGHNVTFDAVTGAPATIGGTNSNVTISRTFPTAGTFTYHCTIHPSMTGTVSVNTSSLTLPPPPPPPAGDVKHS
jgi:plastocyanin